MAVPTIQRAPLHRGANHSGCALALGLLVLEAGLRDGYSLPAYARSIRNPLSPPYQVL
jgi:hypothetical protein